MIFYLFIDRELKDTIIIAYLLEYYSKHAKDHAGWMITVSKALPLLYKFHYGCFQFIILFSFGIVFICETYNIYVYNTDENYFVKSALQFRITSRIIIEI